MTCSVIGVRSAMEAYAAQLVWPASQSFRDVDTAYVDIAARLAGRWFLLVMNLTLLVANFGSGVAAQLGAAPLALWHGPQQRFTRILLWRPASQAPSPSQQSGYWVA